MKSLQMDPAKEFVKAVLVPVLVTTVGKFVCVLVLFCLFTEAFSFIASYIVLSAFTCTTKSWLQSLFQK
jgi:hypothetical protein